MAIKKKEVINKTTLNLFEGLEESFNEELEIIEPTYIEVVDVKHSGELLKINGKQYVLPSLSVGQLKRLTTLKIDLSKLEEKDNLDFATFIILLAFKRNYNDMNQIWLENNLTALEMSKYVSYILSGFTDSELEKQKKSI